MENKKEQEKQQLQGPIQSVLKGLYSVSQLTGGFRFFESTNRKLSIEVHYPGRLLKAIHYR